MQDSQVQKRHGAENGSSVCQSGSLVQDVHFPVDGFEAPITVTGRRWIVSLVQLSALSPPGITQGNILRGIQISLGLAS